MENKPAQNIQDTFLNTVRKDKTPITIYLVSGVKLTGKIRSFDKYSVLLENNSQEQLIFKHAISTVVSNRSVMHTEHRPGCGCHGYGTVPGCGSVSHSDHSGAAIALGKRPGLAEEGRRTGVTAARRERAVLVAVDLGRPLGGSRPALAAARLAALVRPRSTSAPDHPATV